VIVINTVSKLEKVASILEQQPSAQLLQNMSGFGNVAVAHLVAHDFIIGHPVMCQRRVR
jgi:hypothetical protein